MINTEVLKSVPLLSALLPEQLTALASCVTSKRYSRGALILQAGQIADALFVMQAGRAKVIESRPDGREVILSMMGTGDFFGEMALLDDLPCSASVEALEPCALVRISKADFTRCMGNSFELTKRVMLALVNRLRRADRQIESLALLDVYGRVARVLLELAKPVDGMYLVAVSPSQIDLARMVGASREMVSRVLKELKAAGHITIERRRIILLDSLRSARRYK